LVRDGFEFTLNLVSFIDKVFQIDPIDLPTQAGKVHVDFNQVVSKRMVKKQQMRWTESGAHNLLQVRTKVLNDEFRESFVRWYPGMQTEQETEIRKKAA
jgi:hypothetical protein